MITEKATDSLVTYKLVNKYINSSKGQLLYTGRNGVYGKNKNIYFSTIFIANVEGHFLEFSPLC